MIPFPERRELILCQGRRPKEAAGKTPHVAYHLIDDRAALAAPVSAKEGFDMFVGGVEGFGLWAGGVVCWVDDGPVCGNLRVVEVSLSGVALIGGQHTFSSDLRFRSNMDSSKNARSLS